MSTPDFSKFEKIQMKELPRLLVINIDNDEFENDQYLKFRNVFRDISIPQELKFFNSEKQIIYKFVGGESNI